jgi:hypothetical protein
VYVRQTSWLDSHRFWIIQTNIAFSACIRQTLQPYYTNNAFCVYQYVQQTLHLVCMLEKHCILVRQSLVLEYTDKHCILCYCKHVQIMQPYYTNNAFCVYRYVRQTLHSGKTIIGSGFDKHCILCVGLTSLHFVCM